MLTSVLKEQYTLHWHNVIVSETVPLYKECVAIPINICPWQDPMKFGIKVLGTPCGTPGCGWDVKCDRNSLIPAQNGLLHTKNGKNDGRPFAYRIQSDSLHLRHSHH